MSPPMRCWVLGASGLLGQGVVRRARELGWEVVTSTVPWDDPSEAVDLLVREARAFLDASAGSPWSIAWCAGAGVVGTGSAALEDELSVLAGFLSSLAEAVLERDAAAAGSLFVASSAGGVYAGADGPPFDERTTPRPLAPYGELKLRAEEEVAACTARCGLPALVGRISNLFGPGQDLTKPQGLVSQVGRSYLTRQPVSLHVSLDTRRDYLFVDDCAAMVVDALQQLTAGGAAHEVITKILASGRSTTIAAVLGEYRRVFKRPPPVVLASSASSRFQVRDLRVRSVVWTELDAHARTTLASGIAATVRDVSDRLHASV